MAGQGKGVLRIAIEDFLDTFEFHKSIINWVTKVIEHFENEALETYEELAAKLEVKGYLPPILSPEGMRTRLTRRPMQIVPILISIGMMVLGIMIGVFQPVAKLASYKVERFTKTYRPSPHEAFALARKLYGENAMPDEILKDLGLDDSLIKGYEALSRQLLSPLDYVQAWRRGFMTDNELLGQLKGMSFDTKTIEILLNVTRPLPSIGDLIRMSVREAFSPEIVSKFQYGEAFPQDVLLYTRQLGMEDEWVKRYWYAHWELPSPQQGYEMLHRLRPNRSQLTFTDADLDLLLRTADYAPYFRDRLKAISYNPITRVDIRRMYKLGIFDSAEVKQRYMDIGYTDKDADALMQFTIKYETESGGSRTDEITDLTASVAKRMYLKGIITVADYRKRLADLKFSSDVIDLYVKLADAELSESLTPDYRKDYVGDMKADIERAFAARMITETTARESLKLLGISDKNADYIIRKENYQAELNALNSNLKLLVEGRLSGSVSRDDFIGGLGKLGVSGSQQAKVIEEVELQLQYRNKRLTETQYRTAVLRGLMTVDDYREALVGLGYTDKDIELLIQLYLPAEGV